jgi:hypothetical protein
MVIESHTKQQYFLQKGSLIFFQRNHGRRSGLGRMDATSTLFAKNDSKGPRDE